MRTTREYKSQAARDAQEENYGNKSYWDYLEQAAQEDHNYYTRRGDKVNAALMLTRSLSEALADNDGD